jgi:ubiquinone/menaquinone biosynthesis C-methylase UbiE
MCRYLQQPERVFSEIYRVLKPGGMCIMTFSNRLFYNKVGGQPYQAYNPSRSWVHTPGACLSINFQIQHPTR